MKAKDLFEKAQVKRNNGLLNEAIADYKQARELAIKNNEEELAAHCLHMMGVAEYQLEKYDEAAALLHLALYEFKYLEKSELEGAVFRDLGLVATAQDMDEEAEDFFKQSIETFKKTDRLGHLGMSQVKLGKLYAKMNQLDKAELTIRKGLEEIERSQDRFFESTGCLDLAKVLIKAEKEKEAKEALRKAEHSLNELDSKHQFKLRRDEIKQLSENCPGFDTYRTLERLN